MATTDSATLLRSLDKWDKAWADHDPSQMQKMLAQDCTLHAGEKKKKQKKNLAAVQGCSRRHHTFFKTPSFSLYIYLSVSRSLYDILPLHYNLLQMAFSLNMM
jgi:hypothetical protein